MTLERGETLLVTFAIPLVLLVFFSEVPVLSEPTGRRIEFLAPGVLGLAVMSSAMVSLGIATGFERSYGVLRRLGVTPLGRKRLIVAKMASVLVVELAQSLVLLGIAAALGWRPHGEVALGLLGVVLGTACFSGIGLLLAGVLRAELNLAASNGLYVILLLLGGIVFPLDRLGGLAAVARWLPAGALSGVLHPSLGAGGGISTEAWIALAAWSVIAPLAAVVSFRFD